MNHYLLIDWKLTYYNNLFEGSSIQFSEYERKKKQTNAKKGWMK